MILDHIGIKDGLLVNRAAFQLKASPQAKKECGFSDFTESSRELSSLAWTHPSQHNLLA
jgi:hypothetical protein